MKPIDFLGVLLWIMICAIMAFLGAVFTGALIGFMCKSFALGWRFAWNLL